MFTQHFNKNQDKMIPCPCCGKGDLSVGMYVLLEVIRIHFNAPVIITSGCRCMKHHKEIYRGLKKPAPEFSDHLLDGNKQSNGVDIKVKGYAPIEVYHFLNNTAFKDVLSLGVYPSWLHVGLRGYRARWGL